MKIIIKKIMFFPCKILMFFLCKLRKNRYIVFSSFNGKQYSDNPKAISEAIHDIDPTVPIVWFLNNPPIDLPSYIKVKKYNLFSIIWTLSAAKIWVSNCFEFAYISDRLFKDKKQYYLDTWHGDRGFKKIGYDMNGFSSNGQAVENGFVDCITSGSKFFTSVLHSGYRFKGTILEYGCPRNDILFNSSVTPILKEKLRNVIPINEKKLILFAPTFDGEATKVLYNNSDIIYESLSEEYELLFRKHNLEQFDKSVFIDVSSIDDMAELLCVSDILITDYSSCAGDFIISGKPVIICQFDDNRLSDNRGFYFSVEESGFLYVNTIEDLINTVKNINNYNHYEIDNRVLKFYEANETGEASSQTARFLLDKFNG